MKNHQHEMLEIIDGFKNLTYKIKKDNDQIKDSIKNKDETIKLCKSEYQKLYVQYNDLQKRYDELEAYILEQQQQQQQQQQQLKQEQEQYKQVLVYPTKKRKRYVIPRHEQDESDDDDDDTEESDDFEYVKIEKTKPKPKKVKKKKSKGIMEYISDN